MEDERDIVVFADEEGNEIEMDVIDYFEHEGQEYAVLMDMDGVAEDCGHDGDCDCEDAQDIYIMKVVVNGDMEEFIPVEEELLDTLIPIVEELLFEDDEEKDEEE